MAKNKNNEADAVPQEVNTDETSEETSEVLAEVTPAEVAPEAPEAPEVTPEAPEGPEAVEEAPQGPPRFRLPKQV